MQIGVYDPAKAFGSSTKIGTEHTFIDWNKETNWGEGDQHKRLTSFLTYVKEHNRQAIVTLEPWGAKLVDIYKGKHNAKIDWVAVDLKSAGIPVTVRFMHEMDNGTRYAWSSQKPTDYIKAYQYVADRLRSSVSNLKMMWSPAGNSGLKSYYPGSGYADYVGLSLYSYPAWEIAQPWYGGKARTFAQNYGEKYSYVKGFNKPIVIAELGVTGDTRYTWLQDAFHSLSSYPLTQSIVLFNDTEKVTWPNYGTDGGVFPAPDWRIDPTKLEAIL